MMKKYGEQITTNQCQLNNINIIEIFLDIAYVILIVPLIIITIMIYYQLMINPGEIPNVFGYKIFMILDGNMDETLKYGDLIFTQNINADKLKEGDIIAFKNGINMVTIHKIEQVTIDEENDSKIFVMNTRENETTDSKYVKENSVEGLLVKRIPNVGLWIIILQKPVVLITTIITILIIGLIAYYIAQQLDERDRKKIENQKIMQKEEVIIEEKELITK